MSSPRRAANPAPDGHRHGVGCDGLAAGARCTAPRSPRARSIQARSDSSPTPAASRCCCARRPASTRRCCRRSRKGPRPTFSKARSTREDGTAWHGVSVGGVTGYIVAGYLDRQRAGCTAPDLVEMAQEAAPVELPAGGAPVARRDDGRGLRPCPPKRCRSRPPHRRDPRQPGRHRRSQPARRPELRRRRAAGDPGRRGPGAHRRMVAGIRRRHLSAGSTAGSIAAGSAPGETRAARGDPDAGGGAGPGGGAGRGRAGARRPIPALIGDLAAAPAGDGGLRGRHRQSARRSLRERSGAARAPRRRPR